MLYCVSAILALVGETEALKPARTRAAVPGRTEPGRPDRLASAPPPAPPPVGEQPAPRWPASVGLISGVSGITAGLTAGFWTLGHSSPLFFLGLVAATLSGAALVGVLTASSRPWEGSFLMIGAGLMAALPSLLLSVMLPSPALGLWGLASNLCLAGVGSNALKSRTWCPVPLAKGLPSGRPAPGPAPARAAPEPDRGPAVPHRRRANVLRGVLVALAAVTALYAGLDLLGLTPAVQTLCP